MLLGLIISNDIGAHIVTYKDSQKLILNDKILQFIQLAHCMKTTGLYNTHPSERTVLDKQKPQAQNFIPFFSITMIFSGDKVIHATYEI